MIVAAATESLIGVVVAWPLSDWRPNRPAFDTTAWALIRTGGHITGYNIAQYITTTLDNILLSLTWGAPALGLYDKGYQLATQPIIKLLVPVNRIAVPLLVRLLPDAETYTRTYLGLLRIVLIVLSPAIITGLVMSRHLVNFFLGPQWDSIWPVVTWLCAACFAIPVYTSTYWIFVSQGRVAQQLRYAVLTSIISVTSFIAGLPWGPAGVAAGAGLSFVFLSTPAVCWGATRSGPVKSADMLLAVLPFLAAGLPTAAILQILADAVPLPDPILLPLELFASYGVFIMTLLGFPSGRRIVRSAGQLRTLLGRDTS